MVLAWNWTDPLAQFRPLSSHNVSAHCDDGWDFFLLLTSSQHYLLYSPVVSTSSTCERLSLRCIINRGRFVESFAVWLVFTGRRPNYRRDRPSFCLVQSFSRFLCLLTSLRAALAIHDDATISLPRHFSILCCSFLDGPSFSTQKVLVCPPPLLISMHWTFMVFFLFFSFLLHGVLAISLSWFGFFSCLLLLFQSQNTVYLSWLDVDRGREDVRMRK